MHESYPPNRMINSEQLLNEFLISNIINTLQLANTGNNHYYNNKTAITKLCRYLHIMSDTMECATIIPTSFVERNSLWAYMYKLE